MRRQGDDPAELLVFDFQAEGGDDRYSIKNQEDGSWVVIQSTHNGVEVRYAVCDSEDAAKQQAEEWEQQHPN